MEETGYVLEQDSEYCQKYVEEDDEVNISITQKGGKTIQHQVRPKSFFCFNRTISLVQDLCCVPICILSVLNTI